MKAISIIIATLMCATVTEVIAQRICGSTLNLSEIQRNDPARYQRIMQIERQVASYVSSRSSARSQSEEIITIPVVVHVLHTGQRVGTGLNISMAKIQSQIDVLNEDFRRTNPDRNQTLEEFQGVAADVQIQFELANADPEGNSTTGVVRRQTSTRVFNPYSDNMKLAPTGSPAWPTDRYLNIWVCKLSGMVLGRAQFPDKLATDPSTDGVIIETTVFGRIGNDLQVQYNRGRTATHEVGHWLNLRHIWGDTRCGARSCHSDDGVDDTPTNQEMCTDGCPSHPQSSCGSNDMFQNYMDYTDDRCMNLFTNGQKIEDAAVIFIKWDSEELVNSAS